MLAAALALADTVAEAFPPPAPRVSAGAWGEHLRALPLRPAGTPVRTHDGRVVDMPAARVVEVPLVPGDLQQCADSVLRLRAAWLRDEGRDPAFHYTSGFLSRWSAWTAGDRPVVRGGRVAVRHGAGAGTFEGWLADLFTYAGTRSLLLDTHADAHPDPGDLLVSPGSPGHAVLLLDVVRDGSTTWVLVGQGYMPAMDFHVVAGPEHGWYRVDGDVLPTAPIAMPWAGLRSFDD